MFGPLMHTVKSLEAESIIPGHCTGIVKKKHGAIAAVNTATFTLEK